ncbi:MAG: tetratricopeptide repeat protein [Chakrabartia sp.]
MLLIALALAASPAAAPEMSDEARFLDCVGKIDKNPDAAIEAANAWRLKANSLLARQCLSMAYAARENWAAAATAFAQTAQAAEAAQDPRAAGLWVQAGNAALALGDMAAARSHFDAAIILGTLTGADAGEARLDRARALVGTGDLKSARTDLDAALGLVPEDPLAWLLSAALARRMGDLARAQNDIGEAAKRAPDDASVALEAGNIAALAGRDDAARTAWEAAARLAPNSPVGAAATRALSQFPPADTPAAPPTPPAPPKP